MTNPVEGDLVYTGANKDKASVLLHPESGNEFAEFTCFTATTTVEGSVLGDITPVNEFSEEFTLSFSQTEGIQHSGISYWSTKDCETTEAYVTAEASGFGGFEHQQSAIGGSTTLTTDDPIRINSSEC